jgi:hypothetical protein
MEGSGRVKVVARKDEALLVYVVLGEDADDLVGDLRSDGWKVRLTPLAAPRAAGGG